MVVTRIALMAWLAVAGAASAQIVRTNSVMDQNPITAPVSIAAGETLRYTVYGRLPSGSAYNLTNLFGRYIVHEVRPDYDLETTGSVTIVDGTNGHARVIRTFPAAMEGWHRIDFFQSNNSNYVVTLAWDDLSVTSAPTSSGGGGDCNVSVTSTTVVEVTDGIDTIGINEHQTSSFNIAVSGGGIGLNFDKTTGTLTITNRNVFSAAPGNAQVYQFDGTNYYWGNLFGPNLPAGTIGTNLYFITNSIGAKEQVIIPPGVTNGRWHIWGAGGGYGGNSGSRGANGGYLIVETPLVGGSVYDVYRGLGGSNNAASISGTTNMGGWFGGGEALPSDGRSAGSGGGCAAIYIGGHTDLIHLVAAAPGGGGAASVLAAAIGGGIIGQDGASNTNAVQGFGARESDVYGIAAVAGTGHVSAADGGWLYGGPPVITNASRPTIYYIAGSGCGCPGGGGAVGGVSNVTGMIATGGAGVPYVNTNYCSWGYSTRSSTNIVNGWDSPAYLPGFGIGSTGGNGVPGGPALVVLEY